MEMDFKQLALAIKTLADDKSLPQDTVQEIVEQALAAAYRRDYGEREQDIRVTMNLNSGDVDAYITKVVVETVENAAYEISLKDAQLIRKDAKLGEEVEVHERVNDFGRVAAQTAKQVILQRLREAERDIIMNEFEDKINSVVNAIVSRVEGNIVRLELGKAQGIMPRSEQIQGERYYPGQRVKVYLKDVERGPRGPQLVVSRGCPQFVEWLFAGEVPEMESGAVEIVAIVREGGVRTKLAVRSTVSGVDPVGTFVGGHGTRVNAVTSEIGEQEKIDIIVWNENSIEYIKSALAPAKVSSVKIDDQRKRAVVSVPEDQLSITIGRGGQNVRLASKLTGYELDVQADGQRESEPKSAPSDEAKPTAAAQPPASVKLKRKSELENSLLEAIEQHGE